MNNRMKILLERKTKLSHNRKRNKIFNLHLFRSWQSIDDNKSYFEDENFINN